MMGRPGRLIRGQGLPGAVFWKWEPPVPYIPPAPLGCPIFLYGSERDANEGANWGGSGALIGILSEVNPSRVHLYAVTNDHVVDGCPVVRLVKSNGDPHMLAGSRSDWEPHPDGDDIAIRPLGAVTAEEYRYIPAQILLTQADISPIGIGPGDDCFMVGRYINQEHEQFDRPVTRFGNLAMLPEPVYQDERSFWQESFLVDMRTHAGFSGSPVIVYYEAPGWRNAAPEPEKPEEGASLEESRAYRDALLKRMEGRDVSGVMSRNWLLGLEWGHLPVWDDVFDDNKKKIGRMRVSTGMAGVVPAWKLTDLLNEKDTKMARDKTERQLAEKEGAAVLDASQLEEFAQFEDLTRKLVQVPKRELDEKRKDDS